MPNNTIGKIKKPTIEENIRQTMDKRAKEHSEHAPLNLASKSSSSKIGPRNAKYYEKGIIPTAHKILYDALKEELNGATEGEINLGKVLARIEVNRSSALHFIDSLKHYGYIEHEPRVRCTWIRILK